MEFFKESYHVRLRKEEKEYIEKIIDTHKDLFENSSHFIRCAIIFFINKRGYKEVKQNGLLPR